MNLDKTHRGLIGNSSLTQSQYLVLQKLQEFQTSKEHNTIIINGSAGTGKTYLLKLFSDYLTETNIPFQVCTPTGRAAQVLRSKGVKDPHTIHSNIYTQDRIEEEESKGDLIYHFTLRSNSDSNNTIYLIDEASMISDNFNEDEILRFGSGKLLSDLLSYISPTKSNGRKIIFFGDNNQLPPVNSSNSPALDKDYLEELPFDLKVLELKLTEVVRQSEESTIIHNANAIKSNIENQYFGSIQLKYKKQDFTKIETSEIIKDYCLKYNKDPQGSVIIAYTNAAVRDYNYAIRENIFYNPGILEFGDRVVVAKNNSKYGLLNGEMGIIKQVSPSSERVVVPLRKETEPQELNFRRVVIEFTNELGQAYDVNALILENVLVSPKPGISRKELRALVADFTNRNKGVKRHSKEFYELLQSDPYFNCLIIKYGYAITCHKAQGGEWPYVYFDFRFSYSYSIFYYRFCYTAITRAKKVLYAINPPHSGIGSEPEYIEPDIEELENDSGTENLITEEENPVNAIISIIQKKIDGLGIDYQTEAKQYRIRVTYLLNNINYKTDIVYNGSMIISAIQTNHPEKENIIYHILLPLKGNKIYLKKSFSTDNFFHEQLYSDIQQRISSQNIKILQVEHFDYQERYTFSKDGKSCSINFYYNNKNRITKKLFHSGSKSLTNIILGVLSE